MKISIAMATYNGAKYIQEQLQSFLDQTRHPDELIITDDCSTDDTENIVREFAKNAPFDVEFHRNTRNLGYCGNFNAALMRTSGDLVFLSDQDDVWFPEKIEYMLNVFMDNPDALLVMNDAELTDGKLNPLGLTKIGQIKSARMDLDSFVMGCCSAVKRELLELCLPIPDSFNAHDTWVVWFSEALNSKVVDERVLQCYRRHESNESKFFANITKKIGIIEILHWFLYKPKTNRVENSDKIEQLNIFIDGINEIFQKNSVESLSKDYRKLLEEYKSEKIFLKERISIRNKPLFIRTFLIIGLAIRGKYKTLGFKYAFRDFLG